MAKQKKTKRNEKLTMWQDRLSVANNEWAEEVEKMDHREEPMACHELIDELERNCLKKHNVHLVIRR